MQEITISIPTAKAVIVRDAVCAKYGYTDTITDPANPEQTIPNPVTKAQFVQVKIKDFLKNCVVEMRNREVLATVATEDNEL
jgi:hypothetical protein